MPIGQQGLAVQCPRTALREPKATEDNEGDQGTLTRSPALISRPVTVNACMVEPHSVGEGS